MNLLESRNSTKDKFRSAEDIKSLNETKQYTLMATGLLESLITDPNLTSSAAKLWEYLYTKAIMNDKLSIKIKYKELAQKFSRNERTIKRYVENLKAHGYLEVQSNYYQQGQRENTFYLKVPQAVISNVKNTKDRIKSSQAVASDLSPRFSTPKNATTDVYSAELAPDNAINKRGIHSDDKTVTLDHDTSVTLNNNIKKDIILNNNVVVDSIVSYKIEEPDSETAALTKSGLDNGPYVKTTISSTEDEIINNSVVLRETLPEKDQDQLENINEQAIKEMNAKINALYIKMGIAERMEKVNIHNEIRQLQALVSTMTVLKNQKNILKSSNHFTSKIEEPASTDRLLSKTDTLRIMKGIKSLDLDESTQKRLLDEITYAIRFGSLRVSQTGQLLSITHAVNISLKLLREKRWETPTLLQKNSVSSFLYQQNNKPLPVRMYG